MSALGLVSKGHHDRVVVVLKYNVVKLVCCGQKRAGDMRKGEGLPHKSQGVMGDMRWLFYVRVCR